MSEKERVNALPFQARYEFILGLVRPWIYYKDGSRTKTEWIDFKPPVKEPKKGKLIISMAARVKLPNAINMRCLVLQRGDSTVELCKPHRIEAKEEIGHCLLDLPALQHMSTYDVLDNMTWVAKGKTMCAACGKDTENVCGACGLTNYCDKKCAATNRKLHMKVCMYISSKR